MINVYKYEATDEDACYEKCIEDLDVYSSDILVKADETEDNYQMKVIKKEDIISYIKEYIKEVGKRMDIDINMEVRNDDDIFNITMASSNNPILIGKDGRTINSLQLLIRQSISNQTGFSVKVNLDASNYKAKKTKRFEYEIKSIVRDVQRTRTSAKLDPMNSYQRRIVHSLIGEYSNISTESVGEEPDRCVVIKYSGE
jgi:Predicted RNA-binding protein